MRSVVNMHLSWMYCQTPPMDIVLCCRISLIKRASGHLCSLQDIITFQHQTRSCHKWHWVNRKYRHVCKDSKCTKFFIKRKALEMPLKQKWFEKVWKEKKNTKQQKWEFESLLFSWVTLIQMNQAELRPPTLPEELPISTCSITITAALLNTNCFMWIPQAEGYINIELDKVLFFSFYVLFFPSFLTLQQHPQVGLALSRCRHLLQKVAAPLW